MTSYLENIKELMKNHIITYANKKVSGKDFLNDELLFNTADLIMLLLQLDIFEIVFGKDSNLQYMKIIEPLIVLI